MAERERALTNRQRVFVEEYCRCWNATEAARRAGYTGSPGTLAVTGFENLNKPNINSAIEAKVREKAMSADEVLLRLAEHARADHSKFWRVVHHPATEPVFDDTGKMLLPGREAFDIAEFDLEAVVRAGMAHLVKKVSWDKMGNRVVEFHDPQAALVQLGKAHRLFTERVEMESSGPPSVTVIIESNGTSTEVTPEAGASPVIEGA